MQTLTSSLTGRQLEFDHLINQLNPLEFTLGGGWDYDQGSLDRYLDEGHKVWLRIPFQVVSGTLDGDTLATDALVRIGDPYVLKHVYNEGMDETAPVNTFGALVNQFQTPVDKDAGIETMWIEQAVKWLHKAEAALRH